MGINSGRRPGSDACSTETGSGQSDGRFHTACTMRGILSRNAFPASNLSSTETPWLAVALGTTATAGAGSNTLAMACLLAGAGLPVFFMGIALRSMYPARLRSEANTLNGR
jgi:hypothetical protein